MAPFCTGGWGMRVSGAGCSFHLCCAVTKHLVQSASHTMSTIATCPRLCGTRPGGGGACARASCGCPSPVGYTHTNQMPYFSAVGPSLPPPAPLLSKPFECQQVWCNTPGSLEQNLSKPRTFMWKAVYVASSAYTVLCSDIWNGALPSTLFWTRYYFIYTCLIPQICLLSMS